MKKGSRNINKNFVRKAEEFYQKHLKDKLEKEHFGEIIAIEPISGEYFFGDKDIDAALKAREKYPERLVYIKKIGHKAVHFVGCNIK